MGKTTEGGVKGDLAAVRRHVDYVRNAADELEMDGCCFAFFFHMGLRYMELCYDEKIDPNKLTFDELLMAMRFIVSVADDELGAA